MTSTIKGYKFENPRVAVYSDIWDAEKKAFKPIKSMDDTDVTEILDSIALAVEAGVVSSFNWPQQFFASKKIFDDFIEQLECYDDCYRISDRWWQALARITRTVDEEGFVSSREIAETLVQDATENGLLDWTKSKKLRYTEAQYEAAAYIAAVESKLAHDVLVRAPQDMQGKSSEIRGYCRRFADYPELSKERWEQASAEAKGITEVALAATRPTKKASAKKAPVKKKTK